MALRDLRVQAQRRSPDEMVEHLKSFEPELIFSAGIWYCCHLTPMLFLMEKEDSDE